MPDVLPNLLKTWGVVPSVSEGRRLLRQGAVEINGEKVGAKTLVKLRSGATIRVGKHRFLRIVDLPAGRHGADKHPQTS